MYKLIAKIQTGDMKFSSIYFQHKSKTKVEKELKWWKNRLPEFTWKVSK